MQPQTEFLNTLVSTVNKFGLPFRCSIGPLPPHEGLTVEINAGYPETSYYDRRATRVLPLLFLCKSNDKQIAFDTLCALKNNLEQLPEYPSGISFKWVKVDTKEPDYVGEQGGHIWACVINAVIYF